MLQCHHSLSILPPSRPYRSQLCVQLPHLASSRLQRVPATGVSASWTLLRASRALPRVSGVLRVVLPLVLCSLPRAVAVPPLAPPRAAVYLPGGSSSFAPGPPTLPTYWTLLVCNEHPISLSFAKQSLPRC